MFGQLISHLQYYLLRHNFKAHSELPSTVKKEPEKALTNVVSGEGGFVFFLLAPKDVKCNCCCCGREKLGESRGENVQGERKPHKLQTPAAYQQQKLYETKAQKQQTRLKPL